MRLSVCHKSKVKKTSMVNRMFSLSNSRPIMFRGAVSSANQVLREWEFGQSGFFELRVQPIGWFHYPDLVQSGFLGTVKSGNQMEGPYFLIVEKLLFSFRLLNLWLVEKGHQPEELFWNMKAASREWHPGGRRPTTSRCFRSFQ